MSGRQGLVCKTRVGPWHANTFSTERHGQGGCWHYVVYVDEDTLADDGPGDGDDVDVPGDVQSCVHGAAQVELGPVSLVTGSGSHNHGLNTGKCPLCDPATHVPSPPPANQSRGSHLTDQSQASDTWDTVTMHGAVQDTQPPRGHQGSIPSDILHFLIVKKDPTFIEINKKVKQKGYFFSLFYNTWWSVGNTGFNNTSESAVLPGWAGKVSVCLRVSPSWPAPTRCGCDLQSDDRPRLRHSLAPAPAANVNTGWYLTLTDGGADKKKIM